MQPLLETARDIAFIILAVETILFITVLIALAWRVWSLAGLLRKETRPILDSAKKTIRTTQGTVSFLSDNAVRPIVRVAMIVGATRKFAQVLTRRSRQKGGV